MSRKRKRELAPEERLLWDVVTSRVTPLRRAGAATSPAMSALPAPQATTEPLTTFAVAAAVHPKISKNDVPAPTMQMLARKERRAIVRGRATIEGKLDLHGMRQAEAHGALKRFLMSSAAAGRRTVLIVTGKGGADHSEAHLWTGERQARGVLRRLTPMLLDSPDMRDIVLGYEPADPRHGGVGALYVRLRKKSQADW